MVERINGVNIVPFKLGQPTIKSNFTYKVDTISIPYNGMLWNIDISMKSSRDLTAKEFAEWVEEEFIKFATAGSEPNQQ